MLEWSSSPAEWKTIPLGGEEGGEIVCEVTAGLAAISDRASWTEVYTLNKYPCFAITDCAGHAPRSQILGKPVRPNRHNV
jgi:hypothetical protein